MRQFCHALPRLRLSSTAASVLGQESDDQCSLSEEHHASQCHLPTVPCPCSWFTEEYPTSRGEMSVADSPALQLPPIELRYVPSDRRDLDVARLLTAENADRHRRCRAADPEQRR